jgi:hypothetical protein
MVACGAETNSPSDVSADQNADQQARNQPPRFLDISIDAAHRPADPPQNPEYSAIAVRVPRADGSFASSPNAARCVTDDPRHRNDGLENTLGWYTALPDDAVISAAVGTVIDPMIGPLDVDPHAAPCPSIPPRGYLPIVHWETTFGAVKPILDKLPKSAQASSDGSYPPVLSITCDLFARYCSIPPG